MRGFGPKCNAPLAHWLDRVYLHPSARGGLLATEDGIVAYLAARLLIARMVLADLHQKLTEFLCLFHGGIDGGFPTVVILLGEMRNHGLSLLGA